MGPRRTSPSATARGSDRRRPGPDRRRRTFVLGRARRGSTLVRALWEHDESVDGLFYRARHDPSRMCVAVFDRAEEAVTIERDGGVMDSRHQAMPAAVLDVYQFALL